MESLSNLINENQKEILSLKSNSEKAMQNIVELINNTDNSIKILNELNNKLDYLNKKLEYIKEADFSTFVFNKLNDLDYEYHNYIETKNDDFNLLNERIDDFNNKVVQIQDYLEHSSQSVLEATKICNNDILDGQLSIMDYLSNEDNLANKNTSNNVILDYNSKKEKHKLAHKNFSLFKLQNKNLINEDDYPTEIVSQILSNSNQYVG
jgi:hypothetical protein